MSLRTDIGGVQVDFLVDTGAVVSLISEELFELIQQEGEIVLNSYYCNIAAVDGSPLKVRGKIELEIKLGKRLFSHEVLVVSDVTSGAILGLDFLQKYDGIFDIAKKRIRLAGRYYNLVAACERAGCCRVMMSEGIVIPPRTEVIVRAKVKSSKSFGSAVVEPSLQLNKFEGVLLARSIIDLGKQKVIPVRLANVTDEAKVINKGEVIAKAQVVEQVVPDGESNVQIDKQDDPVIQELIERTTKDLEGDEKEKAEGFIREHVDCFMLSDGKIGRSGLYKHKIDTGDATPIRQRAYKLPVFKRQEVERQVKEMLDQGIIRPSSSPWSSPITLVEKKTGELRFCIYFRKVNDVSKKDAYPLPKISESLDSMEGACYFSTLDMASGYWQVEMDPDDVEKTAFTTGSSLYEFCVLPFGLSNSSSTFERLMETVLKGLHWEICLIYIDDVIVFGKTFDEHLERLDKVMRRLAAAGLKLKAKKCFLFRKEVKYLGHVVSEAGVKTDSEKVEKVRNWPVPQSLKELRSFYGLVSYYRRFIRGFSEIASPLTLLTKKNARFEWGENQQIAFDALKGALCSAPVLAYPNYESEFILDTDASELGVGAVLSQKVDSTERVIAYFSTTHSPPERNYSVTRKELLAVIKSVRHFKHYLIGRHFTVRTDHGSLRWLMSFKEPQGQVARWIEFLSNFQFTIEHRAGTAHSNADALSRYPIVCRVVQFSGWSSEYIRQAQEDDSVLFRVRMMKENYGEKPTNEVLATEQVEVQQLCRQWEQLCVKEGVLFRVWTELGGKLDQLLMVVPGSLREEVLTGAHDNVVGGHLGIKKTYSKLKQTCYWVGMKQDIANWIKGCRLCQGRKRPLRTPRAALVLDTVNYPLERVALDIMGPLPLSERGSKHILVLIDYFTRWAEAYPIPDQEAKTVASAILYNFIARFGIPRSLHSDQGANFESHLFAELCKKLGIRKTRTTPYMPSSDGMVERFNQTLAQMLTSYVKANQKDWDVHLPFVMMAYRSCMHETTQFSPNMMMLGREVDIPLTLMTAPAPDEKLSHVGYVEKLQRKFNEVHELAREYTGKGQVRMKKTYDRKQWGTPFKEAQRVWLFTPRRKTGCSKKLTRFWDGPYVIEKVLSDVNYKISKPGSGRSQVVHFNRLKLCEVDLHPVNVDLHFGNENVNQGVVENDTGEDIEDSVEPNRGESSFLEGDAYAEEHEPGEDSFVPRPAVSSRGRQYKTPVWMRCEDWEL